ncbi:hypothetical protein SEA_YOSIF_71 [Streptomyces phage Yosif]|uniref:Uncharacterized protein n=1 Tax=Streptomyces phage Yosif TaxID=2201421 RepID=A0A2Z4QDJ4_9CAUD|nr:hypothetical protein KGG71_gp71 [Streptomyces phage Yosif]AWY07635.1 hypothetical protein SEA_YOSIF_71 [Streptomyces phage Yosif]
MFSFIKRHILAVAIGILVGGVTLGGVTAEAAPKDRVKVAKPITITKTIIVKTPTAGLPKKPCALEDSVDCFWDAGRRGNGKGYSFWVDKNGRQHFLDPRKNDDRAYQKWSKAQAKAGKVYWGHVDGHWDCWAKEGDTSYIQCWDGYKTTS